MYRLEPRGRANWKKSPHKRGDVPHLPLRNYTPAGISPQAWGCTVPGTFLTEGTPNLPTSVGMYRGDRSIRRGGKKSPHKRGDVPCHDSRLGFGFTISPQAWGCTDIRNLQRRMRENLPTSVGMYRQIVPNEYRSIESPHKRGDVPKPNRGRYCPFAISPQAWGCTDPDTVEKLSGQNLPTSVGMYRLVR